METTQAQNPSDTSSTDGPSQSTNASQSPRKTRRSTSTVAASRAKLDTAITSAQEMLDELRTWINAHSPASSQIPTKSAAALTSQLRTKLDKVSATQSDHETARATAATSTLASLISVIDPNIDLEDIDDMIKEGKSSKELARALSAKLSEAANV
jgi:hypothetical protein